MLKELLGVLPLTAEVYAILRRPRAMEARFDLARLEKALPKWVAEATSAARNASGGQGLRVAIFGTLRYWLEHVTLLGS